MSPRSTVLVDWCTAVTKSGYGCILLGVETESDPCWLLTKRQPRVMIFFLLANNINMHLDIEIRSLSLFWLSLSVEQSIWSIAIQLLIFIRLTAGKKPIAMVKRLRAVTIGIGWLNCGR